MTSMDEKILLKTIVQHLSHDPVLFFYSYLYPTSSKHLRQPVKAYLHQIDLFSRLQLQRPIRILIGDEIGLGKTIESIAILRYLEEVDGINRILILTPKILINQWKSELRKAGVKYKDIIEITRDTIRDLLDKANFQKGYFIASIDLVKKREHKKIVRRIEWDGIAVDEAHNAGYSTQRWRLIEDLGCKQEGIGRHLLLLSATPHRGNTLDYLYRLYLLDPYLSREKIRNKELDSKKFYRLTHNSIVYRRTKELVNEIEGKKIFTDCNFYAVVVDPTTEELKFSKLLESFLRKKVAEVYEAHPSPASLLAVLIKKRASSSPSAAIKTFANVLEGLSARFSQERIVSEEEVEDILGLDYGELEEVEKDLDEIVESVVKKCSSVLDESDKQTIKNLIELANKIRENDSKLEAVVAIVDRYLKIGKKVIIFTEYRDTLEYLKSRFKPLEREYGKGFFETISGKDKEKFDEVKKKFEGERCKLLIATDVASEGLNLQMASVVVNYEAPWSPVKLEQRMGRVWRLGQKEDVNIYTPFMGTPADEDIIKNLYGKLLAMKDALDEIRPLLGERVQIAYRATATASEGLWERKWIEFGGIEVEGRKEKISEFSLILASLKGSLSQYIGKLLSILSNMNRELTRKSIYPYTAPDEIKENLLKRISTISVREYENYSRKLCQIICKKFGVESRKKEICIKDNLQRVWGLIKGELKKVEGSLNTDIFFSTAIKANDIHHLLEARVNQNGKPVLRELILYEKQSRKIIYGVKLLKYIVNLFNGFLLPIPKDVDPSQFASNVEPWERAKLRRICRERYEKAISKVAEYLEKTMELSYRVKSASNYRYDIDLDKIITFIGVKAEPEEIPENIKKKVEEAAMEVVMNVEKREGRKPDRSPGDRNEHYDIYSYDPKTGEERFIEVKGHIGMQIFGELTQGEFEFGRKKGDKYWLYIVFNLTSTGDTTNAKWIRYKDATRTMSVEIRKKTKYILFPK